MQAIAEASAKARRGDRDAAMTLMSVLADGVAQPGTPPPGDSAAAAAATELAKRERRP